MKYFKGGMVNPVSLRLGVSVTWSDYWALNGKVYAMGLNNVMLVRNYIERLALRRFGPVGFEMRGKLLYSHSVVGLKMGRIIASVFFMDNIFRRRKKWRFLLGARFRNSLRCWWIKGRPFGYVYYRLIFRRYYFRWLISEDCMVMSLVFVFWESRIRNLYGYLWKKKLVVPFKLLYLCRYRVFKRFLRSVRLSFNFLEVWNIWSRFINWRLLGCSYYPVKTNFYYMKKKGFMAKFWVYYINRSFVAHKHQRVIIKVVSRRLNWFQKRLRSFKGWNIELHGRLKRRGRRRKYGWKSGIVRRASAKVYMDYAYSTVILRNSIVGIHVWIHRKLEVKKKWISAMKKRCEKTLLFSDNMCGIYSGMYVFLLGWDSYILKDLEESLEDIDWSMFKKLHRGKFRIFDRFKRFLVWIRSVDMSSDIYFRYRRSRLNTDYEGRKGKLLVYDINCWKKFFLGFMKGLMGDYRMVFNNSKRFISFIAEKGDNAILEEKKTEKVVGFVFKRVLWWWVLLNFMGTRLLEFDIIKRDLYKRKVVSLKKKMYMIAEKKKENNLILSEVIEKNLRKLREHGLKGPLTLFFSGLYRKMVGSLRIRRFEKRFLRFWIMINGSGIIFKRYLLARKMWFFDMGCHNMEKGYNIRYEVIYKFLYGRISPWAQIRRFYTNLNNINAEGMINVKNVSLYFNMLPLSFGWMGYYNLKLSRENLLYIRYFEREWARVKGKRRVRTFKKRYRHRVKFLDYTFDHRIYYMYRFKRWLKRKLRKSVYGRYAVFLKKDLKDEIEFGELMNKRKNSQSNQQQVLSWLNDFEWDDAEFYYEDFMLGDENYIYLLEEFKDKVMSLNVFYEEERGHLSYIYWREVFFLLFSICSESFFKKKKVLGFLGIRKKRNVLVEKKHYTGQRFFYYKKIFSFFYRFRHRMYRRCGYLSDLELMFYKKKKKGKKVKGRKLSLKSLRMLSDIKKKGKEGNKKRTESTFLNVENNLKKVYYNLKRKIEKKRRKEINSFYLRNKKKSLLKTDKKLFNFLIKKLNSFSFFSKKWKVFLFNFLGDIMNYGTGNIFYKKFSHVLINNLMRGNDSVYYKDLMGYIFFNYKNKIRYRKVLKRYEYLEFYHKRVYSKKKRRWRRVFYKRKKYPIYIYIKGKKIKEYFKKSNVKKMLHELTMLLKEWRERYFIKKRKKKVNILSGMNSNIGVRTVSGLGIAKSEWDYYGNFLFYRWKKRFQYKRLRYAKGILWAGFFYKYRRWRRFKKRLKKYRLLFKWRRWKSKRFFRKKRYVYLKRRAFKGFYVKMLRMRARSKKRILNRWMYYIGGLKKWYSFYYKLQIKLREKEKRRKEWLKMSTKERKEKKKEQREKKKMDVLMRRNQPFLKRRPLLLSSKSEKEKEIKIEIDNLIEEIKKKKLIKRSNIFSLKLWLKVMKHRNIYGVKHYKLKRKNKKWYDRRVWYDRKRRKKRKGRWRKRFNMRRKRKEIYSGYFNYKKRAKMFKLMRGVKRSLDIWKGYTKDRLVFRWVYWRYWDLKGGFYYIKSLEKKKIRWINYLWKR